jgi:hypothetical protein
LPSLLLLPLPLPCFAFVFALPIAFLVVIPKGDLLLFLPLPLFVIFREAEDLLFWRSQKSPSRPKLPAHSISDAP